MASVCQPEASFDLSVAAQSTEFTKEEVAALNKRLQWQLDNKSRGLKYVKLNTKALRLIVFTDASFANNKDMTSQIGYVICRCDAEKTNVIHWSSTKCKRVTRSVLASELYAMANGFDLGAVLKTTLTNVMQQSISLLLCTDSKSLFDCIVKLGTTRETRLMINIMGLRQTYEKREVSEVKWIAEYNNPADNMTECRLSGALKLLIDSNVVNFSKMKWIIRKNVWPDDLMTVFAFTKKKKFSMLLHAKT